MATSYALVSQKHQQIIEKETRKVKKKKEKLFSIKCKAMYCKWIPVIFSSLGTSTNKARPVKANKLKHQITNK